MERLFNLDFQLLHDALFLAIAVFVLFFLISYLLFDPARKMLQERKEKIATEIATAAEDKESAAALKAEYEEKLKNIMIKDLMAKDNAMVSLKTAEKVDFQGLGASKESFKKTSKMA